MPDSSLSRRALMGGAAAGAGAVALGASTFVANAAVVRVPAGNHTFTLAPWPGTSTDNNDHFNVTVLELPF